MCLFLTISLTQLNCRAHQQRQEIDRRRFEAAHLKYACLQMAVRYPDAITTNSILVEGDVTRTINEITPPVFKQFEAKYSGMSKLVCIWYVTTTIVLLKCLFQPENSVFEVHALQNTGSAGI